MQLGRQPLLIRYGIRLSLAGVQHKLAVIIKDDQFYRPDEVCPSTHIIKPQINNIPDLIYNKYFCLELANELGLPTVKSKLLLDLQVPALLIERYDRNSISNSTPDRIHQEDFCQALSIPPEKKYQNEGGVSLQQSFSIISQYGSKPALDKLNLLKITIFNFLIGNNDAHGKNFSLLHNKTGVRLAPFYDLVSTRAYPEIINKMAMKIGSKYQPSRVLWRHWQQLASTVDIKGTLLKDVMQELSSTIIDKADTLSKNSARSSIYPKILTVIKKQVNHINNYFKS